ncbi:bifunctional 2-polyprenyl-6-hydroxyphenol methylase/3-demethylubiquinol 3-O-methyltransferase UbiG [Alphaproteobacteria bacterium]|nr:bifunctional 2-polyprenyl-6-hydroxyphenol methylase/3-demethylubiquinol 3-O-methyltransferase UbiG [Alphaproteobacteria bacterium]
MSINKEKYYEPLRLMMPIRHQYMKKIIANNNNNNFKEYFMGKKILDIGTGTGEFLSLFTQYNTDCTGIDSYDNFKIKKNEKINLLKIDLFDYFKKNTKKKFDVIFCFEVIEHIEDKSNFFKLLKRNITKNGLIFLSTINRNYLSKVITIDIAENILNLLPKKTHNYDDFLTTGELKKYCIINNLNLIDITGIKYNPIFKSFNFTSSTLVNYITTLKN